MSAPAPQKRQDGSLQFPSHRAAECGTASSSRARATRPGEAARRRASLSPTPSPGLGRACR
jgi:hypothetical protein